MIYYSIWKILAKFLKLKIKRGILRNTLRCWLLHFVWNETDFVIYQGFHFGPASSKFSRLIISELHKLHWLALKDSLIYILSRKTKFPSCSDSLFTFPSLVIYQSIPVIQYTVSQSHSFYWLLYLWGKC